MPLHVLQKTAECCSVAKPSPDPWWSSRPVDQLQVTVPTRWMGWFREGTKDSVWQRDQGSWLPLVERWAAEGGRDVRTHQQKSGQWTLMEHRSSSRRNSWSMKMHETFLAGRVAMLRSKARCKAYGESMVASAGGILTLGTSQVGSVRGGFPPSSRTYGKGFSLAFKDWNNKWLHGCPYNSQMR